MTGKMYRIGEAAALLGLKSYVLRFWETEFSQLEPTRTEKGQRLYTEEHIELLKLIKNLLHGRGLTIDGARRILNSPDSKKKMQEEKSSLIVSEFSSELLLGREYLDEEYEDDEAEDIFDPRIDAFLSEVIEELEDIRELLAPLDDISGGNSADYYFDEPITIHESIGSESMTQPTDGYWDEGDSEEESFSEDFSEEESEDSSEYDDVADLDTDKNISTDIQANTDESAGPEEPVEQDGGQMEEEFIFEDAPQSQLLNTQFEHKQVEAVKAFCADAEAYEEDELEEGSQLADEADDPIHNFLRNYEQSSNK